MRYSFIETAPKSPFSVPVRRIWIGGTLLVLLLLVVSALLHGYNGRMREELRGEKRTQETLRLQTAQLERQQAELEQQRSERWRITAADQLLADQIFDLLSLIPDDTTLTLFEFDGETILFEGVCRRFEPLHSGLERALAGRYTLLNDTHEMARGETRFSLRFGTKKEAQ